MSRRIWFAFAVLVVVLIWGSVMAAEDQVKKPDVNVRFLYFYCNDVDAVRAFYTDLLGMDEQSYRNDEDWGWLMYQSEGMQIVIMRAPEEVPVHDDWAPQPGWGGGELPIPSWSIEVPEARFSELVNEIKQSQLVVYEEKPMWAQDSYWSFPVRDPMGHTVELYYSPKERPESTEWPD